MSKHNIRELLSENYPLLAILIGVTLISLPIGPYRNTDTQLELSAAQGVLKWGYPYLEIKGNLFNLPPLGFYTAALFFLVFGSTMDNGGEGNYWDDYKGADRNHDGIGDSPYTIEETRWEEDHKQEVTIVYLQDNYPLMSPFDIDSVSIELPEWASRSSNPQPLASEPFPVVPVAAVSAVAVVFAAGLLFYFKKRRR